MSCAIRLRTVERIPIDRLSLDVMLYGPSFYEEARLGRGIARYSISILDWFRLRECRRWRTWVEIGVVNATRNERKTSS